MDLPVTCLQILCTRLIINLSVFVIFVEFGVYRFRLVIVCMEDIDTQDSLVEGILLMACGWFVMYRDNSLWDFYYILYF